jgi:hypothetical protein
MQSLSIVPEFRYARPRAAHATAVTTKGTVGTRR